MNKSDYTQNTTGPLIFLALLLAIAAGVVISSQTLWQKPIPVEDSQ